MADTAGTARSHQSGAAVTSLILVILGQADLCIGFGALERRLQCARSPERAQQEIKGNGDLVDVGNVLRIVTSVEFHNHAVASGATEFEIQVHVIGLLIAAATYAPSSLSDLPELCLDRGEAGEFQHDRFGLKSRHDGDSNDRLVQRQTYDSAGDIVDRGGFIEFERIKQASRLLKTDQGRDEQDNDIDT
jgi:hypothetical protein